MALALYRKYRSKKLDDIIGQKHITDILSRAIAQGKISHAYLLTGPRGVGKTSVARILAHEINNLEYNDDNTHLDIIEIDAASNNGVDNVRDLREKAQIAPTSAKKKIYIIDEVHMLSKSAFNALLKILEEPPEHIVFILATTNVEKLPATIVSRTQRYSFKPIKVEAAVNHLAKIARSEHINISKDALTLIAERSDGSFRDSISLLDQLSSLDDNNKEITVDKIEQTLGLMSQKIINHLIESVQLRKIDEVVKTLTSAFDDGASCESLVSQLINALSKLVVSKPSLLPLLNSLIDIEKSPHPQIKLLVVLASASVKQVPKSTALKTKASEVFISINDLDTATTESNPKESPPIQDKKNEMKAKIKSLRTYNKNTSNNLANFNFNDLLAKTKQNCIAIYSVLSKCGHDIENNQLIIYTTNKFYKNKLDDVKYRPLLAKSLAEIGFAELQIQTIPTTIPPKDSQTASVAAIMGGGTEVSLEDIS